MIAVALFIVVLLLAFGHYAFGSERSVPALMENFLRYVLFLNVGIMGLLAAYAHLFMGPETAKQIGWQPGSPFQFEVGMANLSFGVLGLLAYWRKGRFWEALVIGSSLFLLGCFVGHLIQYYVAHDRAPWNIGYFIWFNDLILPLLLIAALLLTKSLRPDAK